MGDIDLRGALEEIRAGTKRVKARTAKSEFDVDDFNEAVDRLRASRERFKSASARMSDSELKDMADIFAEVKKNFSAARAHFKKSGDIAKDIR